MKKTIKFSEQLANEVNKKSKRQLSLLKIISSGIFIE